MIEQDYKICKLLSSTVRSTGIGSVPDLDADHICKLILECFSDIPFCPQLQKADARENMFIQVSENLPCLVPDLDRKHVYYKKDADKEKELAQFFDFIAYDCYDYFKISPEYFQCFQLMLEKSRNYGNSFLKSQLIGPVTFLATVYDNSGRAILHDDQLSDAIICGLAMKGLWQAKEIKKAGKTPVIFYDEPYLSSLGSAYIPLNSGLVSSILNSLIGFIKEKDDLIVGIHCCGNTDWETLLKTDIDILSLDSYGFGDHFALYGDSIKAFMEKGGIFAFGAVPTSEYSEAVTLDYLYDKFNKMLEIMHKQGIDRNVVIENSIFTPSCGMGLLKQEISDHIFKLTHSLALKITGGTSIRSFG